ncbi:hypothetical protein V6N12_008568 [Hibiscus sabdariffa]|uniref:Uncharacterized protein n=1 Tax=Hibiscus sabdariffa TaxID=183260 RepID=A0ABR2BJ85_9ROSI
MLKGLDICDLKHSSGYAAVPRLETWNLAPLVIPMAGVRMGYSSQTNHVRGPAPIQLSFPLTCIKVRGWFDAVTTRQEEAMRNQGQSSYK